MKGRGLIPVIVLGALGAAMSGCGGSEQDAHERKATFPVEIVRASFPARQSMARTTRMVLKVRNPGPATVPNVAVTVDSFSYTNSFPGLASRKQPVWIVDEGPGRIPKRLVQTAMIDPPGGGQTAFVNTWALGPLPAGRTQTFVWHVTPVKAGLHRVSFLVSAGLNGRSRARLNRAGALEGEAGGALPAGHFSVAIASEPPPRHVNPETGQVLPGRYPLKP